MLVYVENEVAEHPRTRRILERLPKATVVDCERYGELFNRRQQNFRLQKRSPTLILAHKHDARMLRTPAGYGIGQHHNFYFAHLLNCPYDCRYCFLQGMFRSAAWVLFVNYEDYLDQVDRELQRIDGDAAFFSGYDCDSLALEHLSGFVEDVLPFFRERRGAWLELRTKSVNLRPLLASQPFERCVVAYSLTPPSFSERYEHGAPTFAHRLEALARLQEAGWTVGLRFDPLFAIEGFDWEFSQMLAQLFDRIDPAAVHSASLGLFRLPRDFHRRITRLYPDEPLLAMTLEPAQGGSSASLLSFPQQRGKRLLEACTESLLRYLPEDRLFPCS